MLKKAVCSSLREQNEGHILRDWAQVIKRIEVRVGSQRARVAHQCEIACPH